MLKINASPKILVERLCDFKNYAISMLCFIGSVCAPDKATLKAENHAPQCTTAGPYNAVPSNLLEVGSVCDLGPDLVGIHSLSLAARYRVSACSTTLSRGLGKIQTVRGHNSAPVFALSPPGRKSSMHPPGSRPGLNVGILSILFNGLCTARRIHTAENDHTCRVGCPDEPDSLTHYNMCPRLYNIFLSFWIHATILPQRNCLLHDLISRVFLRSLQYGIVVPGFLDAFVYAHHEHRLDSTNAGNFGDCLTGRVRFMTAITPAFAHAYQTEETKEDKARMQRQDEKGEDKTRHAQEKNAKRRDKTRQDKTRKECKEKREGEKMKESRREDRDKGRDKTRRDKKKEKRRDTMKRREKMKEKRRDTTKKKREDEREKMKRDKDERKEDFFLQNV